MGNVGEKLIEASKTDNVDGIRECLKNNAPLEFQDSLGWTALQHAARNGFLSCAEQLLEAKADANTKDKLGSTPLYWSSRWGHDDVVVALLKARAETSANHEGHSPLHAAADWGHTAVVRSLLGAGVKIDSQTLDGKDTPLHMACRRGQKDTVVLLLEHHPDLRLLNKDEQTAYQCAEDESVRAVLLQEMHELVEKDEHQEDQPGLSDDPGSGPGGASQASLRENESSASLQPGAASSSAGRNLGGSERGRLWVVTSPTGVYIREEPNFDGNRVGVLQNDDEFFELEVQGDWVRHSQGWSMVFNSSLGVATAEVAGADRQPGMGDRPRKSTIRWAAPESFPVQEPPSFRSDETDEDLLSDDGRPGHLQPTVATLLMDQQRSDIAKQEERNRQLSKEEQAEARATLAQLQREQEQLEKAIEREKKIQEAQYRRASIDAQQQKDKVVALKKKEKEVAKKQRRASLNYEQQSEEIQRRTKEKADAAKQRLSHAEKEKRKEKEQLKEKLASKHGVDWKEQGWK